MKILNEVLDRVGLSVQGIQLSSILLHPLFHPTVRITVEATKTRRNVNTSLIKIASYANASQLGSAVL